MFSKGRQRRAARSAAIPSIISANLSVTGDLVSEGDIQVEGSIKGDVACRVLVLSEEAEVSGRITCDTARIRGAVIGEIHAKAVLLARTARITGDIFYGHVTIEAGAVMEGQLARRDRQLQSSLNLVHSDTAVVPAQSS